MQLILETICGGSFGVRDMNTEIFLCLDQRETISFLAQTDIVLSKVSEIPKHT